MTDSMSGVIRTRSSNCSRTRAMPHPTRRPATRPIAPNFDLESPVGDPGPAATWIATYGMPIWICDWDAWRVLDVWVSASIWAVRSAFVWLGTSWACRAAILVLIWASATVYLSICAWARPSTWDTKASE